MRLVQYISMHKHWSSLIGMAGMYEGANSKEFLFKFDGIVWEVLPDTMDGHRSCLEYVVYASNKHVILHRSLANVTIERSESIEFTGYLLKDITDNHVWLKVGTNYNDEQYPCFIFQDFPKPLELLI